MIPKLSSNRFDLTYKISFLRNQYFNDDRRNRAKINYTKSIDAMTIGRFKEREYSYKSSPLDYEKYFTELYESVRDNGFDKNISQIELARDGTIHNGAHRSSVSIYLKEPLYAINTEEWPSNYNYKYFERYGLSEKELDYGARVFVEYAENLHIVLLWPVASDYQKLIEDGFDVIYKKKISVNRNGFKNILKLVYSGEDWVQNQSNLGVLSKCNKCFEDDKPIYLYLVMGKSLEDVTQKKQKIREAIGLEKSSLHITDTQDEVKSLVKYFLHENSLIAINKIPWDIGLNLDVSKKLDYYMDRLKEAGAKKENYLIDGSMVMALHGIRDAEDIDYIAVEDEGNIAGLDSHNKFLEYYGLNAEDMVLNENNYFFYREMKFATLENILIMKRNRNTIKDNIDVELILEYLNSGNAKRNKYRINFFSIKSKLFRVYLWTRLCAYHILTKVGMYSHIRKIYHWLQGKF